MSTRRPQTPSGKNNDDDDYVKIKNSLENRNNNIYGFC